MNEIVGRHEAPQEVLIKAALKAVKALTEYEQELLFERLIQHCPQFGKGNPDNH